VVYVGVETGVAGWVHSYVEQIGYGGAGMATGVTAIFWTGFVCGRLLAIPLSRRLRPALMLAGSLGLLIAAAVVFVVIAGPGIGLWVVMFVIGLVIAPQSASMIAFAEEHLTLSGKATAAFIASAGLGGLVIPWLLGVLFDARGAEVLPPVVLISAIIAAATAGLAGWLVLRTPAQRPPATSTNAPVT
jgi:fucose permease